MFVALHTEKLHVNTTLNQRGLITNIIQFRQQKKLLLLSNALNASEAHTTSYSLGKLGYVLVAEASTYHQTVTSLRMNGAVPSLPHVPLRREQK